MTGAANSKLEAGSETDAPTPARLLLQGTSADQDAGISEEGRASLERLLAYEAISRAPRLHAVLKFMIDALLDGRAKTINEQRIGEVVFGRPAGYNPGDDNIVRVTIRHLRERVEEFYSTKGRDERYVFSIPKGKYVPILSSLRADQDQELASSADVEEHLGAAAVEEPLVANATFSKARSSRGYVFAMFWIVAGLLVATGAFVGFRLHRQVNSNTVPAPRHEGLLSLLLANGKPTTVVVSDSNLQAFRMIFRKTVPLDAYLDRSYLDPAPDFPKDTVIHGAWGYVRSSPQTSMTSTIIASEIQAASVPEVISLKYPHDLTMRNIEHGNYIFLGGPWINPWGQLFESRLNFRILPLPEDPWRSNIKNMNPLPSEPAVFALHQEGASTISYVRFAMLKNLKNDGYVVLLGGTTEEAVEAGAGFLLSQPQMNILLKNFKVASPEQLPSIEVVIETTGLQGVPEDFRVVAERVVNTQ